MDERLIKSNRRIIPYLKNDSYNVEEIYRNVFGIDDIFQFLKVISDQYKEVIFRVGIGGDVGNNERGVIFPWRMMLYSNMCDMKENAYIPGKKCLGCCIMSRISPSGVVKNDTTFLITRGIVSSMNFRINIVENAYMSGWEYGGETSHGKPLYHCIGSKEEQLLLSSISISTIANCNPYILFAYGCGNRFIYVTREGDMKLKDVCSKEYVEGILYQLYKIFNKLSIYMYTHGNPTSDSIMLIDKKYTDKEADIYYPFTVLLIPSHSDTININNIQYARNAEQNEYGINPIIDVDDVGYIEDERDRNTALKYFRNHAGDIIDPCVWDYFKIVKELKEKFHNIINENDNLRKYVDYVMKGEMVTSVDLLFGK